MLPTIEWLLTKRTLRLSVLETGAPTQSRESLIANTALASRMTAPITWVHSSDLDDPTPFLSRGNVLLTDGAQFGFGADAERYDYDSYVARLIEAGLVGLGFATHFLHQGMPTGLAAACARAGFPLIDVPDRVPFIAVIREVADQIAAERSRRMAWSIAAHKAISYAALKPTGLRSTLIELERQLSCWVGLFDATGHPVPVPGQQRSGDRFAQPVRDEVARALRKGSRSSTALTLDSGQVTIQTLGQNGELRGALALGRGVPLDRAENELVTSVIAMATLALEQNRTLDATRGQLRSSLLELVLAGNLGAARAIAGEVWGAFPLEPLSVVVIARQTQSHFVLDALDVLALDADGRAFFAVRGDVIVVLVEAAAQRTAGRPAEQTDVQREVEQLITDHDLAAGSAAATDYAALTVALGQASSALHSRGGRAGLTDFAEIADTGMLGVLQSAGAERVAHRVLTPLTNFDAEQGAALVETLLSWFANDCSWGATAAKLGVHRHTVRSRIDQAASILNLDLESFEGRLEVWAALRLRE
ncbi:PucR family transcriptional regulator ligand-binding domain-containing protein [Salinibacterium sp. NG22]|uniref:PucR family transcriptional regulator n=1 Tax=Salinibacterium sp. NG22 TaxID=2792040 RepID=UPI0018CDF279|nr:PucR family transcriptional regulator [Salinibacterium sp. NG22]MBH0110396.1 PucR family transcriptional regulator ligand-binding domain-containing protein [Salinibacterium sp. NG22]